MPRLTRWCVKASFLYLASSLLLSLAVLARPLAGGPMLLAVLSPVALHWFVVGWATQLIFGVAHWMFPKYSLTRPRGSETLAWAMFILLNVGLLLRGLGEPAQALQPSTVWAWTLLASAGVQWAAAVCFVVNVWPRLKER